MKCQNCGRDFQPNRDWQRFCVKQCQQAWHRFQYKKAEVMVAEEKANGHLKGGTVPDASDFLEEFIAAQAQPKRPFLRRA